MGALPWARRLLLRESGFSPSFDHRPIEHAAPLPQRLVCASRWDDAAVCRPLPNLKKLLESTMPGLGPGNGTEPRSHPPTSSSPVKRPVMGGRGWVVGTDSPCSVQPSHALKAYVRPLGARVSLYVKQSLKVDLRWA